MPETPEGQCVRRVTRTMSSAKANDSSAPHYVDSDSDSSDVVDIASSTDSDNEIDLTLLGVEESQSESEVEVIEAVAPQRARGGRPANARRGQPVQFRSDKQWMENEVLDQFGSDLDEDDPTMLLEKKEMPQMEPPPVLTVQLLPYQKEFLAWAIQQERGVAKGGILADEMGMGKTIQAISLIVTHRTDDQSELPKTGVSAPSKPRKAAAVKRFNLRLPGAPEPLAPQLTSPAGAQPAPLPGACQKAKGNKSQPVQASNAATQTGVEKPLPGRGYNDPAPHVEEARAILDESGPSTSSSEGLFVRATLVICPLVAVIQWRHEIEKFVAPDTLNVVVYHGPKRGAEIDTSTLSEADVVLTTYSIIESEYRRQEMTTGKVCCSFCNKKFYPHKLGIHLRYFCGPWAEKTHAQSKQQRKKGGDPEKTTKGGSRQKEDEMSEASDQSDSSASDDDSIPDSDSEASGNDDDGDSEEEDTRPKKFGKAATGKKVPVKDKGKSSEKPTSAKQKGGKGKGRGNKRRHKRRAWRQKDQKGKRPLNDKGKAKVPNEPFPTGDWKDLSDDDLEEPKGGWVHIAYKAAALMVLRAQRRGSSAKKFTSILHKVHPVEPCLLISVRWRRIVLDEAHFIKDRRCSTARATFALVSKYKWALSGTPLQNRVAELYSLVRFMRMFPYAYYLCKNGHKKGAREQGCQCVSIDYPFQKGKPGCQLCGHSVMHHYCWWNKYVANPIKAYGYIGKGRASMRLLKREILEGILLRRTKVQCADVLMLPPRAVVLRKDHFNQAEQDYYEALYTKSQAQFGSFVQAGTVVNNYAHIFDLLIRLRQAVNHPYLVVYSATVPAVEAAAPLETASEHQSGVCDICHDPMEDPVTAACGHPFCRLCVQEYLESNPSNCNCPTCNAPLTVDLTAASQKQQAVTAPKAGMKKKSILHRISAVTDFQSSTKIEALREELHNMLARDPAAKAIVFSQFTSMLDLIYFRLTQLGIKCVRLEGSMSMDQRDRMIDAFTNDPSVTVFLMSLKAGGVALNLTAASHVMLMDPWWNPAVEQQAQDRIHRLGQYKPIHVTRFVIAGTIEERILKLQEKKQLVFEGTVGRDSEALGRLTEDDLRFLFG